MPQFRVKNWDQFQHYKDRCPPWIRLHRKLLDNRDYHLLPALAAKYLPLIWLIASEHDGIVLLNRRKSGLRGAVLGSTSRL